MRVCVCVCVCVCGSVSFITSRVACCFILINEGNLLGGVEVRVLEKVVTGAQTDLTRTKVSSRKVPRTTKETRCSSLPTCILMKPPLWVTPHLAERLPGGASESHL